MAFAVGPAELSMGDEGKQVNLGVLISREQFEEYEALLALKGDARLVLHLKRVIHDLMEDAGGFKMMERVRAEERAACLKLLGEVIFACDKVDNSDVDTVRRCFASWLKERGPAEEPIPPSRWEEEIASLRSRLVRLETLIEHLFTGKDGHVVADRAVFRLGSVILTPEECALVGDAMNMVKERRAKR